MKRRIQRFNPKLLWLFDGEGGEGKGPNTPADPVTTPVTPNPEPKPEDKTKAELEAYKQREKETKAKLAKYEKEEADRELAKKSDQERLAASDAERKALQRDLMIERVRRANGFTDAIFDDVHAAGDDEDAIKTSFESFKTRLEDYQKKAPTGKGETAVGGGTTTTTTTKPDDKKDKSEPVPWLVKEGHVKWPKGSVS